MKSLPAINFDLPNIVPCQIGGLEIKQAPENPAIYNFIQDGMRWMVFNNENKKEIYELYSHYDLAYGHVICTGLGFALRESWLLTKPEVTKITVLEKSKDLIEYHKIHNPKLFQKLEIVNINAYNYTGVCDVLLIDNHEGGKDFFNDYIKSVKTLVKNIQSKTMWFWPLEEMLFDKHKETHIPLIELYKSLKEENNDFILPDLPEEKLFEYCNIFNLNTLEDTKNLLDKPKIYTQNLLDKPKMYTQNLLATQGVFVCKDVLTKEMTQFLTHVMLRKHQTEGKKGDKQVPNALTILDHDLFLETLHEQIWPKLEIILEEELLPTYTFARLYSNEDELKKHKDRPACEISITVQLGRSHHYAWPIFVGDQRFDLAEGDGVVYLGREVEHWRDVCDGPKDYYSGQVFFHFVRKNGVYVDHANDSSVRKNIPSNLYQQHRTHLMETK